MKKTLMALGTMAMLGSTANAQKVAFEEYDLENGLHVVLHQDNSAPVVVTSVMYHVGAKDEQPNRTGFAQGAILAAEWIMNKKGLHEFSEVFQ